MLFVRPTEYGEALQKLGERHPVVSLLNSTEWRDVPVALRERAFFSSEVANARFLQSAKDHLTDFLSGARATNERGESYLKAGGRAQFVERMQTFAIREGMGPLDSREVGTLRDIRSESRLALIFDTQTKSAQDYGYWKQGMDPDVLDAFPAQRFVRVQSVRKPRDYHEAALGTVKLKTDVRYWIGLNRDFGVPWGPWGFNSGCDVEDVGRSEAEELNLLSPDDEVMPVEKEFNEHLEASVSGLSPEMTGWLRKEFGDQVVIENERVRWREKSDPPPAPPKPEQKPEPQQAREAVLRIAADTEAEVVRLQQTERELMERAQAQGLQSPEGRMTLIKVAETRMQIRSTRDNLISAAREPLRLPVEKRVTLKPDASRSVADLAKRASEILQQIAAPEILPGLTPRFRYKAGRAHFDPGPNAVMINAGSGTKTGVHELGHWIEMNVPHVLDRLVQFLEKRTAGEAAEKLSAITGNSGYRDSEVAKRDKFSSPYMGKIYRSGDRYYATEILSMGLEEYWFNTVDFARRDPEYFEFIYAVLRNL